MCGEPPRGPFQHGGGRSRQDAFREKGFVDFNLIFFFFFPQVLLWWCYSEAIFAPGRGWKLLEGAWWVWGAR